LLSTKKKGERQKKVSDRYQICFGRKENFFLSISFVFFKLQVFLKGNDNKRQKRNCCGQDLLWTAVKMKKRLKIDDEAEVEL
jgi:hypothetical protein